MSIDRPTINQGETPRNLPRFMQAVTRYEDFLGTLPVSGDEQQDFLQFSGIMSACGELVGSAQTYDFVSTYPDLANTASVAHCGKKLLEQLESPEIPEEVRSIYTDLYGEELRQYADRDIS